MTATTTDVTAHKLACILATIHTTHLIGDDVMVTHLLNTLPKVLGDDPNVAALYYGDDVDEYLEEVEKILYPEGKTMTESEFAEVYARHLAVVENATAAPVEDEEEVDEDEEAYKELYRLLFNEEPPAREEEEDDEGVCGNPDCVCSGGDEDNFSAEEELIAETDEFVIVKIWK